MFLRFFLAEIHSLFLVPHISRLFAIASANLIYEVCLGLFCWLCESYGVYLKLLKGIFNDLDMLADAAVKSELRRQQPSTNRWDLQSCEIDAAHARADDEFGISNRLITHSFVVMMISLVRDFTSQFYFSFFWHDEIYLLNSYSMMSRLGIVDRISNKSIKNYVRGWNSSRASCCGLHTHKSE